MVIIKDAINTLKLNISSLDEKSEQERGAILLTVGDLKSELELFLFSDLLILNRDKLKTANSFVITLHKDSISEANITRRVNIRNIIPLENFIKKSYDKVIIEINGKSNLNELQELLNEDGETKVQIKVKRESKVYTFSLKKPRKFNFNTFNNIRSKEYVKKVSF